MLWVRTQMPRSSTHLTRAIAKHRSKSCKCPSSNQPSSTFSKLHQCIRTQARFTRFSKLQMPMRPRHHFSKPLQQMQSIISRLESLTRLVWCARMRIAERTWTLKTFTVRLSWGGNAIISFLENWKEVHMRKMNSEVHPTTCTNRQEKMIHSCRVRLAWNLVAYWLLENITRRVSLSQKSRSLDLITVLRDQSFCLSTSLTC